MSAERDEGRVASKRNLGQDISNFRLGGDEVKPFRDHAYQPGEGSKSSSYGDVFKQDHNGVGPVVLPSWKKELSELFARDKEDIIKSIGRRAGKSRGYPLESIEEVSEEGDFEQDEGSQGGIGMPREMGFKSNEGDTIESIEERIEKVRKDFFDTRGTQEMGFKSNEGDTIESIEERIKRQREDLVESFLSIVKVFEEGDSEQGESEDDELRGSYYGDILDSFPMTPEVNLPVQHLPGNSSSGGRKVFEEGDSEQDKGGDDELGRPEDTDFLEDMENTYFKGLFTELPVPQEGLVYDSSSGGARVEDASVQPSLANSILGEFRATSPDEIDPEKAKVNALGQESIGSDDGDNNDIGKDDSGDNSGKVRRFLGPRMKFLRSVSLPFLRSKRPRSNTA